jgi:N-acetylmuramoyl-L-alanine amidase
MKKIFVLAFFLVLLGCNVVYADGAEVVRSSPDLGVNNAIGSGTAVLPELDNPIKIVHPVENAKLPALTSTFVCGSVPPDGKLTINGQLVPVHPDGGFVAMVDLAPGKFAIQAELKLGTATYQATRNIEVAEAEQPTPVTPLAIEYVLPREDRELLPGDTVTVVCKGSPGMQAYFTIEGVRGTGPLYESATGMPGIYRGTYRVNAKDQLRSSRLKVILVAPDRKKVTLTAAGKLSLFNQDPPKYATVSAPDVVLRAGPALGPDDKAGYLMFPPEGTCLQLTGRIGNEYRVRLNNAQSVWVSANQIQLLPLGTSLRRAVVGNLKIGRTENSVQLRIPLRVPVPYKVVADSEGKYLELSLFGAYSNTDRIANTATGVIRQVGWFQDDRETYRLRLDTFPKSWWGYDIRYEEGGYLVLELRLPPPLAAGGNPLAGLKVAVDAGHGAGGGALGVSGDAEGDVNLAIATLLREKLLAKGAQVVLTRPGAPDVALAARPKLAWEERADLLISIHNNALGPGGNPFRKHGFEIYYYTPMSLPLAREIHEAYGETFGAGMRFELSDGGLCYGNLALTRAPQMPAVLVESAYMIHPVEAVYLKTEAFRTACAEAMLSGIERYVRRMRQAGNSGSGRPK